jgi:hypothetical protein
MTLKLFPSANRVIAEECIPCYDVFALMINGVPVSPTAPPKRRALSLLMGVIVCPKRACGLSPVNSILYIVITYVKINNFRFEVDVCHKMIQIFKNIYSI